MGGKRWAWRAAVGACVLTAVMVVASTWDEWKTGQVDPGSASIALMALALAVAAAWQSVRAARVTDNDTALWAARLAEEVYKAESRQRVQLLGGQDRTIDVAFVFVAAPGRNALVPDAAGSLEGVVAYFRNSRPRRLVVTGEAGAGKTVLAIELILGLLEVREPEDPVPVRLSAATWDPQVPVAQWVAAQLVSAFFMAPRSALRLVETGRVLPVIDGLDEMDADPGAGRHLGYGSAAARAVRALNTYQQGRDKMRLVITCRTGQYEDLVAEQVWAYDAARIALEPIEAQQAAGFIRAAVTGPDERARWRPVLDALRQQGHPLARGLSTPWRLRLAVTVYAQRDPDSGDYLRDPAGLVAFTHPDALRDHLLGLYIPAATAAEGSGRYRPEQVHTWLAVLARHLNDNTTRPPFYGRTLSATDLALHQLWPLAGRRPHHLTVALTFLLPLILPTSLVLAEESWWAVGALLLPSVVLATFAWMRPWREPARLELAKLKTRHGLKNFAVVLGLVLGLWLVLVPVLILVRAPDLMLGLVLLLMPALAPALALAAGLAGDAIKSGTDPREPIRNDLLGWLAFALAFGLAVGLIYGLMEGLVVGLGAGLMFGLGAGLTIGLTSRPGGGSVAVHYGMLVLCTRGKLPGRPGRFLHWCYQAGLVRISGVAYQFRHRELQDYLAAHPFP